MPTPIRRSYHDARWQIDTDDIDFQEATCRTSFFFPIRLDEKFRITSSALVANSGMGTGSADCREDRLSVMAGWQYRNLCDERRWKQPDQLDQQFSEGRSACLVAGWVQNRFLVIAGWRFWCSKQWGRDIRDERGRYRSNPFDQ